MTSEYGRVTDEVLDGLRPPRRWYYYAVTGLACLVSWFLFCWVYQVKRGMGVAGINHPVGWGVYIANFVFWIGIGHAGTLISAILHLVRSKWRAAISRSSEAMTVFAVMTAGLFPLIHLGRVWVFYYIIPYPSQRQLWPNFMSPLIWDVCAITTYFIVSVIFFYVGLIPDLASLRDRYHVEFGPGDLRSRVYRALSLGWVGSASQWGHYGRGYLFFAALATPLVISVHSVVSFDFAMALLPGWHTTIYAPYFVAGAIHSGLAMVILLLIPLRRLLRLESIITVKHLEAAALTMIATALIVGYAYVLEPFIAWYSGDVFERQFSAWRATGSAAWMYWLLAPLNVIFPIMFVFKRVRSSLRWLFLISLGVTAGMWLERVHLIVTALWRDFLPHNWGPYFPTWVEISITVGSFAFFAAWFLGFSKLLPTVSATEVKQLVSETQAKGLEIGPPRDAKGVIARSKSGIVGVFSSADRLLDALAEARKSRFSRLETFSPVKIGLVSRALGLPASPVRYWALAGGLLGLIGGFALAIGAARVNGLFVGGKWPVSLIPYCIVGFEGTILIGTLGNLTGLIVHARLGRKALPAAYDRRFSRDRFGLLIACGPSEIDEARRVLAATGPEEIHVVQ